MARATKDEQALGPYSIVNSVDYPVTRDELVQTAMDSAAPAETINFLRCLHDRVYESADQVLRDFGEAEARFGMGNQDGVHRGDIGKEAKGHP